MNTIRACLAGSGLDVFSHPAAIERLLALVPSPRTGRICVAYLGTATYDLPRPQQMQTELLLSHGCEVRAVRVADPSVSTVSAADVDFIEKQADVVLVSGGNTLYAVRRWEETGLAALLRAAAARQVVLAGGSAGAICWFTSGHSDSADPATYQRPEMMRAALDAGLVPADEVAKEEDALAQLSNSWSYIRVHGLNLLPCMLCPHYDATQGNGVRRAVDFASMLKRHPTERGIGIDHWAMLVLPGNGQYEIFVTPGHTRTPGAEEEDDANSNGESRPGVFTLDVVNRVLQRRRVADSGAVSELLRAPTGPVVADPFERYYAMENPTPSSGSLLRR